MAESLHVYSNPISQPSRSVIIFCKHSGIPHECHFVDLMKGENLTEDYIKINPYQSVPAIVHGTYNLWESAAIVPYIADAFDVDNQWYPKDIKIRGRINAYLHWHHQGCREIIAGYIFAKLFAPKFMGAPELTPEAEAALRTKVEGFFETFKWILSETGFAARTTTLTIADIFAYSEIAELKLLAYDLSPYPEVKAWFDRISECAVVTEAHEALCAFASQAAPQ